MRSAVAKQHGLDEALVAQIASTEPALSGAQLVALELADALMIDPAGASSELRERLARHYTREQVIELALDVMKWSYQKVPVALGTDVEIVPGVLTDLVFDDAGRWVTPS